MAVFPPLVDDANAIRAMRGVLDESIAIALAPLLDPLQCSLHVRQELTKERLIASPTDRFGEEHDEERCGVDAPVVGCMRYVVETSPLAVAHFVQDLARFLLPERIDRSPLQRCQSPQRFLGATGRNVECLQGHDQTVPAKRCNEPGDAGSSQRAITE